MTISIRRRLAILPHQVRAALRRARPGATGSGQFAIVALSPRGIPVPAWKPFRATRLVGGRAWSLSVIRTDDLTGYPEGQGPVNRELIEETLDLLAGEHTDPGEAEAVLRRALDAR